MFFHFHFHFLSKNRDNNIFLYTCVDNGRSRLRLFVHITMQKEVLIVAVTLYARVNSETPGSGTLLFTRRKRNFCPLP